MLRRVQDPEDPAVDRPASEDGDRSGRKAGAVAARRKMPPFRAVGAQKGGEGEEEKHVSASDPEDRLAGAAGELELAVERRGGPANGRRLLRRAVEAGDQLRRAAALRESGSGGECGAEEDERGGDADDAGSLVHDEPP